MPHARGGARDMRLLRAQGRCRPGLVLVQPGGPGTVDVAIISRRTQLRTLTWGYLREQGVPTARPWTWWAGPAPTYSTWAPPTAAPYRCPIPLPRQEHAQGGSATGSEQDERGARARPHPRQAQGPRAVHTVRCMPSSAQQTGPQPEALSARRRPGSGTQVGCPSGHETAQSLACTCVAWLARTARRKKAHLGAQHRSASQPRSAPGQSQLCCGPTLPEVLCYQLVRGPHSTIAVVSRCAPAFTGPIGSRPTGITEN